MPDIITDGALVTFMVALITIANPIGNLAIFASLTGDRDEAEKKAIATKSALAIALILVIVTWSGSYLPEALRYQRTGLSNGGRADHPAAWAVHAA